MYGLNEDLPEVHEWKKDTVSTLCDKIDKCGGWHPKAVCVSFFHGDIRKLRFFDYEAHSGYWTICLTRDEYYWERISKKAKKNITDAIRQEIRSRI